ncbi:MAG: SRPBCC family protein [Gammaproteobacteria bacterium]|uniref:SRPBCC family protein n=1 Tax=Limnobacter sp. TaxID=2003368 RepID=UPI001DCAA989|nr:SRPBCC family protein [Limnobacter sp.]MBU0782841.1 SRPBCC family protein [Gammaproteobacteria bacterium]MBU0849428.1 SRPBCC family protein [Gammaproteobacteria bacterium]MBU1266579.1 SRPBCC family protein [Gammaproteobacteria bacterium]MBU1527776.1 SRPBCC family protein [Gammaproteobacteria bacterium]MBU1779551.1 SRPBCC family protein [Gammaproteobacteria bacterium]
MPVNVNVKIEKSFKVACSAKNAFDQLSDVADTVALFPKLDKIVDLGDEVWRWEMAKIGAAGISHQVKYTVKYNNDGKSKIDWNPVPGDGNATVSGGWVIKEDSPKACTIAFRSTGEFEMPVPRLMKGIAEGIVKSEFDAQVGTFLDRVKAKLES